jgi:hypothetical protein
VGFAGPPTPEPGVPKPSVSTVGGSADFTQNPISDNVSLIGFEKKPDPPHQAFSSILASESGMPNRPRREEEIKTNPR